MDPAARWDGKRVVFEVRHDGSDVSCAVSPDALRALTSRRCFKPKEVLDCFAAARPQVEAIARGKLRARTAPPVALLTVWSEDVEDYRAASGDDQRAAPGDVP
ncbi:DUF1488 family protein [Falsiroseomonas sp. HW251]|uniref:DUF1488 family protein n=1 Tax=Falsiroseomonas sp. HW251 TaxID=3390998 RepID=UPI003D323C7A